MLTLDIRKTVYGTSSDRQNCECHAKHERIAHLLPELTSCTLHSTVIMLVVRRISVAVTLVPSTWE